MKRANKRKLIAAGLKPSMKYAVGFMAGEDELWIRDIRKFHLAKQYSEMLGGTVFLQDPEYGVTDAIWPKQMQIFRWSDMNECLLHMSGMKKEPLKPMFNYQIHWTGCNGAGEAEEGIEYEGQNRKLALAAIKKAKGWMGYYGVLSVRGREKIKQEKEQAEREAEDALYNEQYHAATGPDIIVFSDGTMAFDEASDADLDAWKAEHGKEVERHRYWDYFYSLGIFADRKVSNSVRMMRA